MVLIKKEILEELIRISKAGKPNEVAAYLFNNNTIIKKVETNDESPVHFSETNTEIVLEWITKYGKPTAIFHSHPMGAQPSYTDLKYMCTTIPFYGCIWLIMSGEYELRAWKIGGSAFKFPRRGETIYPIEIEVKIIE